MLQKVYHTRSSNAKEKVKYVIWTNIMDHWLLKTLAENAKDGYRPDNSIKPATFEVIIEAFRKNFGMELTKEHIKNRRKTLKKQYGILKEIIAQRGFKWDNERKIIVANDATWKEYIKENHEAKAFRGKVFENYDLLRTVAGNDQTVTCCINNDAELDVDLMADDEVVEIDFDSEIQSDDKQAKKLRWTEQMDNCLGKVLAEQVQRGYKMGNTLHSEAYEAAIAALTENFGLDITKDHVKNRLKTWRKQYSILNELLSHGGFKWDEAKKMVEGDDLLWNEYLKTHSDARAFRGKVIENYDYFFIIFSHITFAGKNWSNTDSYGHNLSSDYKSPEPINASPIRCWSSIKDVKNISWTDEMDCCLSLVLVEQVRIGNKTRIDNRFNAAAYDAAISALSETFHFNFTKDHVINRMKAWKKLYGSVKEILEHSEFKWDKECKMIVADNSTWQNYIKINPDARLLHGRMIGNYDDLSIIFGNDDVTEFSGNGIDLDLDWALESDTDAELADENQGESTKEMNSIWTDEMDNCLTEKLIEQVKLGNKLENGLKHAVYALNEEFASDLTEDVVNSRLTTWKKLYKLVKELISKRGFKWDDAQKAVLASDCLWDEHIKRNPDVDLVRGKCIENFDQLHSIFGNNCENGCETSMDNTCEAGARPSSSSRSKQPCKRRRSTEDVLVEMMSGIAANIGRIADALTESSNQPVSLDEVFDMVKNMPGFDDDLVIEACEFLSLDDKRAKMFLKLDERLRRLWLLKRLRSRGS